MQHTWACCSCLPVAFPEAFSQGSPVQSTPLLPALSAPARPTGRLTHTCKLQLVLYDTSLWAAFIDISCHYVRAVTEHAGSLSPASVSKHRGGFTDCTDARWCEEVPWESWAINNRVCVIYNLRLRKGMRGRWEGVMEMNEPNDEAQTGC